MAIENRNLKTGLAALKAGDYPEAIAQLETVLAEELHPATIYKAKMALVKAYEGDRQLVEAWKLCEELSTINNKKVSSWADRTLDELDRRYPDLAADVRIGGRLTRKQKAVRRFIRWLRSSEQRVTFLDNAWDIIQHERQNVNSNNFLDKIKGWVNIVQKTSILVWETLGQWLESKQSKRKN